MCSEFIDSKPPLSVLRDRQKEYQNSLEANISPADAAPGSVVAAQTRSHPNYYYFWVRDGSLVMNEVFESFKAAGRQSSSNKYRKYLEDFVAFTKRIQNEKTLEGLGEPKFEADGRAFNESWGRPQSDGPALRAMTLVKFANELIARGEESYVRAELYDGKWPDPQSPIKRDLEYIVKNWEKDTWDAWEEIRGFHFYTRVMQIKALEAGGRLARALGDTGAASTYQQTAAKISSALEDHWDIAKGHLVENIGRTAGLTTKENGLDALTILATLHGYDTGAGPRPSDPKVLATARAMIEMFRANYEINKDADKAVAIGRYKEDVWFGGNPWPLATYAFGEFYYRTALDFQVAKKIIVRPESAAFFAQLLEGFPEAAAVKADMTLGPA
ncbi:MAG: glycoside hydrolase family 15 protein, partial [Bdellovibrionia bacterium]